MGRLIGDDAHRGDRQARKPDDEIPGEVLLYLKQIPIVHDVADHVGHVVGLIRRARDDFLQDLIGIRRRIRGLAPRRDRPRCWPA
jgi:hypothetical protein